MTETTVAYLAGIIDGEGYIGIKRSPQNPNAIYHERVQVRMVDERAIALLAQTLGGNYYCEKPHAHNGRPLFCWQASDALACKILRRVLPYLLVKREQAENVLALRASKEDPQTRLRGGPTGRTMSPAIHDHRRELYERGKRLNAGGGDANE